MKTKTIFVTDDGKKFSTKEAAEAHEKELGGDFDFDTWIEQISKNNERLDEINQTRIKLAEHIDALNEEFDKVRAEQEKLFKEHYGEENYKRILERFTELFERYFDYEED